MNKFKPIIKCPYCKVEHKIVWTSYNPALNKELVEPHYTCQACNKEWKK